MSCDNPKLGIVNNNVYAKYDPNPSILTQDIERKPILGINQGPLTLRNESEIYVQTICTSSDHDLIICEVSNYWPKTAGGVELTKHPLTIRVSGKN